MTNIVANYLQRVIASGAMTSVAVRPPMSFAPVVPIARPPLAQAGPGLDIGERPGQEHWAPELAPRTARPSQPATAYLRKPDVVAAPLRADVADDAGDGPVADQSTNRLEKPVENMPAAAPPRAPNPPVAPASPVRLPGISYLPGVACGPRIQAPKGLRTLAGQRSDGDRNAGSINLGSMNLGSMNLGSIKEESPSPLAVEHTVGQVRENRPGGTLAAQPDVVATYAGQTADVTPDAAEPANPRAPRDPERATPAPVQTPVQPQPAREAAARAIAPVSRPQTRLNIGRIDVHVKNGPSAARPVSQPAPAGAGVAPFSALEALGMDRFTIKP